MEDFYMDTLRERREAEGMTRADLASLLCVAEGTVARWERGVSIPRLRERRALALRFSTRTAGERKGKGRAK
jgi:transcriptional regulator with XRE-family HTH domain